MEKRRLKRIRWLLLLVLATNLCCCFPGDMIPLPLFICETGLIDGAFSLNLDLVGIGSKLTLAGQIGLIASLFSKNHRKAIIAGQVSTVLLFIGIPLLMNYRNVHGWTVEFTTWIPFFLAGLWYLYASYTLISKELDTSDD